MAGQGDRRRDEQLAPLQTEREDSGIDDGTHSSEDSCCSDCDEPGVNKPWVRVVKKGNDGFMKNIDDEDFEDAKAHKRPWQMPGQDIILRGKCQLYHCNDERSSPPLYEVELTASDEDDDNSVLELVIPMHTKYHRVPTSSPKKTSTIAPTFFSLFCCLRK